MTTYPLFTGGFPPGTTSADAINAITIEAGVGVSDFLARGRSTNRVMAARKAAYRMLRDGGLSLAEITLATHRKCHTSAIYGIATFDESELAKGIYTAAFAALQGDKR